MVHVPAGLHHEGQLGPNAVGISLLLGCHLRSFFESTFVGGEMLTSRVTDRFAQEKGLTNKSLGLGQTGAGWTELQALSPPHFG